MDYDDQPKKTDRPIPTGEYLISFAATAALHPCKAPFDSLSTQGGTRYSVRGML